MKICFIVKDLAIKKGSDGYGGYRRMAYEIITRVKTHPGIQVSIAAERISGFPEDIESVEGVSLNFRGILKVRGLVKKCDVIHTLDAWPTAIIARLANIGLGKRIIISAVGTASVKPLYEPIKSVLLKSAYRSADKVTAISRFVASEIKKILPDLEIDVVNLGVDTDKFNREHICHLDSLKKVERFKPYILSVGDIRKRKGFHISIAAFTKTLEKIPELNYVIVGFKQKNNYVESIMNFVESNNLTQKVFFLEDVDDYLLEELYHNASIFVLLPINEGFDFEGFGLVFLEAGMNGLASVTTSGNGTQDAVLNGKTALTVAQGDIDQAATAIEKLMLNQNLRSEMGKSAREFAGQMTWDKVIAEYVRIYQTLS